MKNWNVFLEKLPPESASSFLGHKHREKQVENFENIPRKHRFVILIDRQGHKHKLFIIFKNPIHFPVTLLAGIFPQTSQSTIMNL